MSEFLIEIVILIIVFALLAIMAIYTYESVLIAVESVLSLVDVGGPVDGIKLSLQDLISRIMILKNTFTKFGDKFGDFAEVFDVVFGIFGGIADILNSICGSVGAVKDGASGVYDKTIGQFV